MRYHAKLLSLTTLTALLTNLPAIARFDTTAAEAIPYSLSTTLAQASTSDRKAEADRLLQQGIERYNVSQFLEALQLWEQALEINREIGDLIGQATLLGNIGLIYEALGNYSEALGYHQQSLALNQELSNRAGEAANLGNIGLVYQALENYSAALEYHQQSLALDLFLGNRIGAAITIGNIGTIHYLLNEYSIALNYFQQSLALHQELGNQVGEAASLGNIGLVYEVLESNSQALNYFRQSLALHQELGDQIGKATNLASMGGAHYSLGNFSVALSYFKQSLVLSRELSARGLEASVLSDIGIIRQALGQYTVALDYHQQSLALYIDLGSQSGEASALRNIGFVYQALGDASQALNYHQQSLSINQVLGNRSGEAASLGNVGLAHHELGNYSRALEYHHRSLTLHQELGNQTGEAANLGNIGLTYQALENYSAALDYHQQSFFLHKEAENRIGEVSALGNQGMLLNILGDPEKAAIALYQSIEILESFRNELSDNQLISIADVQSGTYKNLEKALISQDKNDEALTITERGRGRAFVLQLASHLASEAERTALEASPVAQVPTVTEIQQIARDTNTTLVTYSLIFDQALYIWVVQPSGEIKFREVEFEGSDGGGPIINPIASIDGPVYRSASPDSALTALVTDSRSAVNESGNPNTPQLQELHEVLIDPIADLLPSDPNAQVAFIPQGELFLVPFAALQDEDGTYLIEKHTILTAPSIQVFGLANESVGAQGLAPLPTNNTLIVGNPTMPSVWLPNDDGDFAETQLSYLSGAKAEAEAIGEFFNISVLTGDQATEARIKQLLPNASLIHLATHGLLEYGIPESSGVLDLPGAVALAPGNGEDGLLTSAEILQMDLQAELAILSACDTGRGRITGDGVVGLSRALITAGVPSVMVSLWAVNDDSTSVLMQRFYEILATGEFTKAEALRQAQLSLLYAEDVETRLEAVRAGAAPTFREGFEPVGDRHPYHWAPFVLIGNGQ